MGILSPVVRYFRTLPVLHAMFWITCFCLGVYANAIQHPFVHDDFVFIVNNPAIEQFDFQSIWGRPVFSLNDDVAINTYYRPLLELVYRWQYAWFGLDAAPYHLVNVFLHLLNAWGVYFLFRKVYPGQKFLPFGVAIVFAIHPVQTGAVAAIAGISNTLVLLWILTAFLMMLSYQESRSFWRLALLVAMGSALFLALLTKEQAIVFPALLGVWVVLNPNRWKKTDVGKVGVVLAGVVVMYFVFRRTVLGSALPVEWRWDFETQIRLLSIPGMLVMYIRLLIWPQGLHYFRSYDIAQPYGPGIIWFLTMMGFAGWVYVQAPREVRARLLFGLAWFLLPLLPVINIIPMVNEYSLVMTAEHFLYWPLIGMALMVLTLAQWLWTRWIPNRWQSTVGGIGVLIIVLLANLAIRQNKTWAGETPLFENMVAHQPGFGRGRMLLGDSYYKDGRLEDGLEQYREAEKIMRRYIFLTRNHSARAVYQAYWKDTLMAMIAGYESLGRFTDARPYYHYLLPEGSRSVELLKMIGRNYAGTDECGEAVVYWEEAAQRTPQDLHLLTALGLCYESLQNFVRAELLFKIVVEQDSDSASARINLERTRMLMDQEPETWN